MKNLFKTISIVALILSFIACKSSKTAKTPAEETVAESTKENNTITENYWKLIELYGKPVVMIESMRKEPHMILKIEDNRVNGNGGCNGFGGTYELVPMNKIKFLQMMSTMMACIGGMEIETEMLKMFEEVDNYTLSPDGKYLSLNKAHRVPLARFEVVYLQ